jgi:TM2 domain-containing membrane protein YozV
MTLANVDMFMGTMGRYFSISKIGMMRNRLAKLDDSRLPLIQSLPYKDPTMLLVVSLFAGTFGIDRFMLGQIGLGIIKLITMGGFGIWTVIDWCLIMSATKEVNYNTFNQNTFPNWT